MKKSLTLFEDTLTREVFVHLNQSDTPNNYNVYVLKTGTSAECEDDGQVERGNDVSGLIRFCRPSTSEAACGKNPWSHVGKIYNLKATILAHRIYEEQASKGVRDVQVNLVSQIGHPLTKPWLIGVAVSLEDGDKLTDDLVYEIEKTVWEELAMKPLLRMRDDLLSIKYLLCYEPPVPLAFKL